MLRLLLVAALVSLPAPVPPPPRVVGLSHAAFFVTDLASARRFYGDLLGYDVVDRPAGSGPRRARVVINADQWIELIEGPGAGEGQLDHVAFSVADAAATRDWLGSHGVTVAGKDGLDGDAFVATDPDGHRIGFVERPSAPSGTGGPRRISTRALHAGVLVGELDEALAFYRGILGFQEFWRGSGANSATLSWVNLRVPDGTDYLELMLYADLPAPGNRGSAHHVCLEVPDMDAALATLTARVAAAGYERPLAIRTGINRKRQLNLFDPDGTRIELMEPATVDDGRPAPSSTLPPPQGRKGGLPR